MKTRFVKSIIFILAILTPPFSAYYCEKAILSITETLSPGFYIAEAFCIAFIYIISENIAVYFQGFFEDYRFLKWWGSYVLLVFIITGGIIYYLSS
jgi:hypothetical protein